MPLSKERMRERKQRDRVKCVTNLISVVDVKPKLVDVKPKVRYAPNHFGEVKSLYHARQFFSTLRY